MFLGPEQITDKNYESRTGPLYRFTNANSLFVTGQNASAVRLYKVYNPGNQANYKIIISSYYFAASQNGTTLQHMRVGARKGFCLPFNKTPTG
jgi:hypothetical protein